MSGVTAIFAICELRRIVFVYFSGYKQCSFKSIGYKKYARR
jgi:hypothetical protein